MPLEKSLDRPYYRDMMNTTNTKTETYQVALVRADGVYQGPGRVVVDGKKLTVEHRDEMGVTVRDGYTIDFGDDAVGCERVTGMLRRNGWKVA